MVSLPFRCKAYIGVLIVNVIEEKGCIPFRAEKAKSFHFYRSRTYVYLGDTEAHCRQVNLENSTLLENKPTHVHVSVNYFNTSGLFTHEAAVAWTEAVTSSSFQVCVLTAGRLDRIPPDGGLTFVDFIVYQGNPMGSITGHEVIPTWWDGTSCKEEKFSRAPYILVSKEHSFSRRKHDAATVWAENVESTKFTVCLREMQNFDGLHGSIIVTVKFNVFFSATPYVMVSACHNSHYGYMPEEHNSIAAWVEAQVVNEAEAQAVFYASNMILMYFTRTITQVFVLRRIKSSQDKYDP
ncbi:uncharacterized protein [Montipora foliosa]|uniref:uncharacterized protein n=1 Tax=Montipora foliosa TaxID=591990 RepID=UPI0035F2181A